MFSFLLRETRHIFEVGVQILFGFSMKLTELQQKILTLVQSSVWKFYWNADILVSRLLYLFIYIELLSGICAVNNQAWKQTNMKLSWILCASLTIDLSMREDDTNKVGCGLLDWNYHAPLKLPCISKIRLPWSINISS